jgi:hypothetical protein
MVTMKEKNKMDEHLSYFYNKNFYNEQWLGSYKKAKIILPIVLDILPKINSAVDFGCGTGVWLSVLHDLGVNDIMGYDGAWVEKEMLRIPVENFKAVELDKKYFIERRYDLAMSIEVAEHLPEEAARIFVETLTKASDIVLFSAAIPMQGGQNHINEQWQDYWCNIFKDFGYIGTDIIRRKIWNQWNIEEILGNGGGGVSKQNIILYINSRIANDIHLNFLKEENNILWNIVHPETYIWKINNLNHLLEKTNIENISLFSLYKVCIKRTIKKIAGERTYKLLKKILGRKK